ncbi:hypothetical protein BDZ89DRAFT_1045994 [Hymenopellis radicata]|nr:hypothetical protein BDZ89DRAFT_1045994 [Hymenopellis radicata]
MRTPAFIIHIKAPAMEKQPSSGSAVVPSKPASKDVAKLRSFLPPSSNSLPALTQHFKRTLSLSLRHSSKTSSSSLLSRSATSASTSNSQPTSHTRSISDSFPRMSRMNLRSLFTGRSRNDKLRRNTVGSLDDMETEEESLEEMDDLSPLRPSPPPRRKGHAMCSHDVSLSNDTDSLYFGFPDEATIPSRYPVTGPMHEEEPLALDTLFPPREFDDDEDTSEPEEEDVSLMKELILGRIDFRM